MGKARVRKIVFMNNRWFYCKDEERLGPISFGELKALVDSKALEQLDLVWCSDFGSDWRAVAEVDELNQKKVVESTPPPKKPKKVLNFDSEFGYESYSPSVAEAVDTAWKWMRIVLFKPFNLTRWFGIGFCVWLASFGSGNGGNFNTRGEGGESLKPGFDQIAGKVVEFVNDPLKISAIAFGILFILFIYVLILKLKSRGEFMLIRRWYSPDDTIGDCWRDTREPANIFFRWRIGFYGFLFLVGLINIGLIYNSFLLPYVQNGYLWDMIYARALVISGAVALISWFVLLVGEIFGVGFVVPILYWHGVSAGQAWRKVFELCNQFPGAIILYVLSLMGMWFCFAVILVLVIVITCCIAALPLMIPYIGVVCLLPVYFFFRGYPICFIAQWRDNFIPGVNVEE